MAKCPNCGQETARTADWCCQWCGYPLLSGSYKKLDKTYKELKGERLPVQPEPEPEPEAEEEPEPEPEPEEEPEPEAEEEPEPEPEAEEEPEPEPEAEEEPEPEPEPEEEPEPEPEEEPEPEPEPEEEPEEEPEPEPKPKAKRKPATRRKAARRAKPAPAAIEITVEELLAAYDEDLEGTDAKFANQLLKVTGIVNRIEIKAELDIYYITLIAEDQSGLQGVRCVFDRQYGPELEELTSGQTLTVQGEYQGSVIDMNLRNCTIIS